MIISSLRTVFYAGLILALAFNPGLQLHGQQQSPVASYEVSLQKFEAGQFRAALAGFVQLKQNQPANVLNFYYLGRCLVELNEELDEAIELLYGASRRGAPDDAYFYLAKAYHRDYNFSEAKKYYTRFEQMASRQQLKDLRVSHKIATCRSALEITASYNQYEVITVTLLDLTDSLSYSQIRMKGGQLQRKPAKFYKPGEDRDGFSSLMFMPHSLHRGDNVFYSAPGKNGKDGLQLYRVKKGAGRTWGDPVEFKTLNTGGDELLPYYDPIENDLYFASNGGPGVGGYDLFRAHYDPDRDEWTEALNLGFPINSAMDDYLLLPGSDLGMMMFFSNRQGTDSTLTVYRVHFVEPKLTTNVNDTRKLRQIATAGGAAEEILAEMGAMSDKVPGGDNMLSENGKSRNEGDPAQVYTPVNILVSEEASPAVVVSESVFLSEALKHQETSDSLKGLAVEARSVVRESEDPNDRWVWQKQIMVWEKKSHDEKLMADELYARMEADVPEAQLGSPVNSPETVASPESLALVMVAGEPGSQPEMGEPTAARDHQYIKRFDILGSSPYSKSNPIPTDVALPDGVFYRIQLGAYGSDVDPATFGGISPVTAETLKDRGLIKYYAGKFTVYEDVSSALPLVKSRGYEDAFVSAWYNGNPVSTQKAKELE